MAEVREDRLAKVENILEQVLVRLGAIEHRMDQLESRVDRLEGRMDRLDDRIDRLYDKMDVQFRWVLTLILTSWITIVLGILGLFIKL